MGVLRFHVNDELVEIADVSPTRTVLEFLRTHHRATGTKEGCAEGDCGACTIVELDVTAPGGPRFRAVNSCLMLLPALHGRRIHTVEGLVRDGEPHLVQRTLAEHLGSQCGYCTPGVVMSLFEACHRTDLDADWKLDDQMCGNLCRCTGYRPIRDATHAVAGAQPDDGFRTDGWDEQATDLSLEYQREGRRFFTPGTLDSLVETMEAHPDHRLLAGATDLGLDVTKGRVRFPCLISLEGLPELRQIERTASGWTLGAMCRLADLEADLADELPMLVRMLRFFGARQIKNRATLGGNLCNASPIGDTPPVLLALDATLVLRSRSGERRVSIDDFFEGYRKTALRPGEFLTAIEIPRPPADARMGSYKVSRRRELDISAVCAAMRVRVDAEGIITEARIAYGGMAATPARAHATEAALIGSPYAEAAFAEAAEQLATDFQPLSDHRGSAWYRGQVARNLLIGFHAETIGGAFVVLPNAPSGTVVLGGDA